jgi:hypothetical protein
MTQTTTIDSHNGLRRPQAFTPALTMPSYVEALVDPGGMFRNPAEVAEHAWFSREEKRTVLLSWARDELVLEQVASTALPELKPRSRIAAVIDALAQLDPHAAAEYRAAVRSIRAQIPHPSSTGTILKTLAKAKSGRNSTRRKVACRTA